jgi:hypothetical protein
MKLHTQNEGFDGIVPENRIPFKISTNAKLFGILSDGIYKDKVLAVIRELSCNAYDAHIAAKQSKKFRVQVPSRLEPTFAVIDEGTGIDPEKIADIFWTYGESTKTNTNDQIGALGLGSKSPFAYTKSSFVVKNRFKGKEHTYFCFINESGVPDGSEVSVTDTTEPNGITVELAVRIEDINAFHSRISNFFKYWEPKAVPEFIGHDITIPKVNKVFSGTNWYLEGRDNYYSSQKAIAVMGNVPYPIDLESVPNPSEELKFIANNPFTIIFPLGDLSFQASREELSYEKVTVDALERMAMQVFAEFKTTIRADIEANVKSPLELMRRFKAVRDTIRQKVKVEQNDDTKIAYFFDKNDLFTVNGKSFTAEALDGSSVDLTKAGTSALNIMIGNGTNSSGRWTLKQARSVVMTKNMPKDPADLTKGDVTVKHEVQWYRPSLKPMLTANQKSPASLLFHGFTPKATRFIVNISNYSLLDVSNAADKMKIRFVINDMGTKGGFYLRTHGKKKGWRTHHTFFVEQDKSVLTPDFGLAELTALLEGTLLEGAEVSYLSKLDGFEVPKEEDDDEAPKERVKYEKGSVEVRMLTVITFGHKDNNASIELFNIDIGPNAISRSSDYERIQPKGYDGLYVLTSQGSFLDDDKSYLDNTKLAWLIHTGAFSNWINEDGVLKIIARKQEDIDDLIKRGATLHRLSDVAKAFLKDPTIKEVCKQIRTIASSNDVYALKKLRQGKIVSAIIKALNDPHCYFTSFFSQAEVKRVELANDNNVDWAMKYCLGRIFPFATNTRDIINDTSSAERAVCELFDRYPLLRAMVNDLFPDYFDSNLFGASYKSIVAAQLEHLVHYIKLADELYAQKQAAEEAKKAQLVLELMQK